MGYFSWKTSDTKKTIWNINSRYGAKPSPVYLITEDGRHWAESKYEGYGEFGGKDVFVLISELNGFKPKYKEFADEEARNWAFDNVFLSGIKKGDKKYILGKDFKHFDSKIAQEGDLTPNQLKESHGWQYFSSNMDWTTVANEGFKMPKIVEKLPSKEKWASTWVKLPYPASAENQGYFKEGGSVEVGNFDITVIITKDRYFDEVKQIAIKCGGKYEGKQKRNTLISIQFAFDRQSDSSKFIKEILTQRQNLSIEDVITYSDVLKAGGNTQSNWKYTIGGL